MFKKIETNKIYINILDQIKEGIRTGELKKGDRLPSERDLAQILGVSRAAVREAIRSLEIIGLVDCKQGEGNFITSDTKENFLEPMSIMYYLNNSDLKDILALRRALEIEAGSLLVDKINEETIEKLQGYIDIMESDVSETEKSDADRKFHYTIAKESGNVFIDNILSSLSSLIDNLISVRRNRFLSNNNINTVTYQHRQILQGLKNKDKEMVRSQMKNHLDYVYKLTDDFD